MSETRTSPHIPRSGRVVLTLGVFVGVTMAISLVSVLRRHDYEQIVALVIGVIVSSSGLAFVRKVLNDHERLQEQLHESNAALVQSQGLLQNMFDLAASGMVMVDVNFNILDMNDSLAASLGSVREGVKGMSIRSYLHPDELSGAHMRFGAMLQGDVNGSQQDLRLKTVNGDWKWFSTSTSLVRNPDDSPAYFITQAIDIGDRISTETALLEQRELHRRLLAALSEMGECVAVGEGDHIVWVNDAYAALAGYEPDELIGAESLALFADAEERERWAVRSVEIELGMNEGMAIEANLRKKDGSIVPIEGSTHRITVNGRHQRISVIRDVSDRRRWEQAITERSAELVAANDELREVNKLKSDLIGMLSHEIGQPLTTIVGYSEMLVDDWDSMGDEMRRKGIDRIDAASHNLSNLVDEMLTMIRADASVLHATVQTVSLRKAVERASKIVRDVMPDAVQIEIPEEFEVLVDANHFQQVMVNLFTNAAKYGMPPFQVVANEYRSWIRLEVIDHGGGVPEEFIPQLFARFSRATNEVTRSAKGTGLGLFIVSNLLGASNATVHYQRNEPQGSRFILDLQPANVRQLDAAGVH